MRSLYWTGCLAVAVAGLFGWSMIGDTTEQVLDEALALHYADLFEHAVDYEFTPTQIDRRRQKLKSDEDYCVKGYEASAKTLSKELKDARSSLRSRSDKLSDEQRHELHCRIQSLEVEHNQAKMFEDNVVPLAYDNLQAKLDILEFWPDEQRKIRQEVDAGTHHSRRWGDVQDIGFREIEPNQEKDIERGKKAVDELKSLGMIPKEMEDERLSTYVNGVAQKVAQASDLTVPLKITLLESPEINAFALPGGFLYVNRGLLEAVDDESQLAGVIAHETAHVTARHSHRLMKKATIASILYEAARIGAVLATGGVAGLGAYYAIEYGFYGLGLALNLELLGVSRDYELEADQLGVQYAWNAGYDPSGFIRFFDKMAHTEGYVRGASWFRTHPPFYQRMVQTQREIEFLPAKETAVIQTQQFVEIRDYAELCGKESALKTKAEEACRPTLYGPLEQDCPEPKRVEYKPGDPIDQICSFPR